MAVVEESNVPIKHFRPTHVANCFDDAIAFAKMGGNIDFTSGVETSEVAKTLAKALELAPLDKITLSSDSNGSMPIWNEKNELIGMGVGKMDTLYGSIKALITEQGVDMTTALKLVTENVAKGLEIYPRKGALLEGQRRRCPPLGQQAGHRLSLRPGQGDDAGQRDQGKELFRAVSRQRERLRRFSTMRLEEISWKQAERYFERKDIAVIPVGSIENHGSQLALGTDFLIPKKLTEWVERELDVLVLPGVPYGVANHHQGFPGTISLGEEGLYLVMSKIVWALYEYGIRKFVFLNGHGGNDVVLNKLGLEIEDNGGISALFNWWQIAGD